MMGRNHVVAGSALGVGTMSLVYTFAHYDEWTSKTDEGMNILGNITHGVHDTAQWIWGWMVPYEYGSTGFWLFVVGAVALFWLGCLLPDIDNPTSILGRYVPFDTGLHHGFTHTDWITIGLALLALIDPTRLVFYLLLGVITHNELDGRSHAGRVRFWPLGRWDIITYSDGVQCVVRKKYRRFTYKAGSFGETIYVFLCIAFAALCVVFMMTMLDFHFTPGVIAL